MDVSSDYIFFKIFRWSLPRINDTSVLDLFRKYNSPRVFQYFYHGSVHLVFYPEFTEKIEFLNSQCLII